MTVLLKILNLSYKELRNRYAENTMIAVSKDNDI
jgi:hypothetical protein